MVPKPRGYLRLEYPEVNYVKSNLSVPFSFEKNELASITSKSIESSTESYAINIKYPALKGTIFLTYKAINGSNENLTDYLRDAENLTTKHMIKADEIPVFPFENIERRVFGKFYELKGNVASQSQFHVTDSINHFIVGSLYFYAKPNYDSILPAVAHVQKDIRKLMESIRWKP